MKTKAAVGSLAGLLFALMMILPTAHAAAPKYNATGVWDYQLSSIWYNCGSYSPPPMSGTFTVTQSGSTFVANEGGDVSSGKIDGTRYLRWESEYSGMGKETITSVFYMQTPTTATGTFVGSYGEASGYACSWAGNISAKKRTSFGCQPSDTLMCLQNGRYSVSVTWRNEQGETGVGHAVPSTDDSGLFWFFKDTNMELLIKVLNACGTPSKHYWVFFAATTDQEFTVTVTDLKTYEQVTYTNPLKNPADAVTDTSAFATCP